ncbi:MAG: chemotaxis protein CheX [Spirochaetales bacterium]|nr:chemotaxis protein CheX [Spirochaetales bacterium]
MKVVKEEYDMLIRESFEHILEVMFEQKNAKDEIKLLPALPAAEKREIAILIQLTEGVEGKIILTCSLSTANRIAKALSPDFFEEGLSFEDQKEVFKDSLGELMNILAGKIAYHFQRKYGTTRITTPTIVSGNQLKITVYENNALNAVIEFAYGIVDIILTLN